MKYTPRELLELARTLCQRLDASARLAVPLSLSISAGLSGCAAECYTAVDCAEDERCVGAQSGCPEDAICILPVSPSPGVCEPEPNQCFDGIDNDLDGAKDCSDGDCGSDRCIVALYMAPF